MKTALIIEHDGHCRAPAAGKLRELGWEVIESSSGEDGLELCRKHLPDLTFCDLRMEPLNGFQFCRAVRGDAALQCLKIVALSGPDYPSDRTAALEAGADECLHKSNLLERLEEVVSNLTAGAPLAPPLPVTTPEPHLSTNGSRPLAGARLRFWGVRGSIPTPGAATVRYGGNTSCVEVRAGGEIIILDAGTGIRALGEALAAEFKDAPLNLTLLISHTHWDHIQGFPFFLPAYHPQNRLRILGYEGARAGLGATLAGQMESPYFPIALKEMPGNIVIEELREMAFSVGGLQVESCFSKHPGVCVGYKLRTSGGTIVYVPDNELAGGETGDDCSEAAELIRFIQGADVLIIDSQYDRAEYDSHTGWGHGCLDDVVRVAMKVGVKHLYLFHHDPGHDDAAITAMVEHGRALVRAEGRSALQVDAAREGEELILHPEPVAS